MAASIWMKGFLVLYMLSGVANVKSLVRLRDVLSTTGGVGITLFYSKFTWRIFSQSDSQFSYVTLTGFFKQTYSYVSRYKSNLTNMEVFRIIFNLTMSCVIP